jgi:dipeptidyl aminopeptidase/acylaminoacyl peptidase
VLAPFVAVSPLWFSAMLPSPAHAGSSFTVAQILSLPTPENLIVAPTGAAVAWTFNERGVRNVYVAEAPSFKPRRVTAYSADDGQELTQLAFTPDARTIVYVRGGDHGGNRSGEPPNPAGGPSPPVVSIWSVPAAGGPSRRLGNGDTPAIAPDGKRVAFVADHRMWLASLDGSSRPAPAFFARGAVETPTWSPDGRTLAFITGRGDHAFIGLFTPGSPIRYLSPSTSRDSSPIWSSDGRKVAFLRQPGLGGAPRSPLAEIDLPWSIMVAEIDGGGNALPAATVLTSGDSPVDPILRHPGGMQLRWAADDMLVFLLYRDGWPHLYSLRHAGARGVPLLLTPGPFMVEQFTLTPDGRSVVFTANTGSDSNDVVRRHLFVVPVSAPMPEPLTRGTTIDWSPAVSGDSRTVLYLSSDARRPPLPTAISLSGGVPQLIAAEHVPADFPAAQLVIPEAVSFPASDGVSAHGQLFRPADARATKHPAVVYVHGGGPRQMLLGWHTRWEYASDYGANQYLTSRGFIVLSVDYRLSVGYGQAFQFPKGAGVRGAAEYLDILAAGRYLQARSDVDPRRIGIWGASYGGYLTALALGRNSDVFSAGVDMHGVHDRLLPPTQTQMAHAIVGDGITETELRNALQTAYESSPISAVATWTSPVLLVHGDDDRVVDFRQTVDLERRLIEKGVKVETLVLPDDVHDALLWKNWNTAIAAMAEFFERALH